MKNGKKHSDERELKKASLECKIAKIVKPYLVIHELMEIIPKDKWQEYHDKTTPVSCDLYFDLCKLCKKAEESGLFSEAEIGLLNSTKEGYKNVDRWIQDYTQRLRGYMENVSNILSKK